MKLPFGISENHPAFRWIAAGAIGAISAGVAMLLAVTPKVRPGIERLDNTLYDTMYQLRPVRDMAAEDVVIVVVDDRSLKILDEQRGVGWPWPRDYWAACLRYLEICKPKVVAFDIIFAERSVRDEYVDDDTTFGDAIRAAGLPLVFANVANAHGVYGPFAPKACTRPAVDKPVTFGAANTTDDAVIRTYNPIVFGRDSLARQAVLSAGLRLSANFDRPFRLHYYGPHALSGGKRTFRYISAASLIAAGRRPQDAAKQGITPEMFKDKIVLFGAISVGTYDLKSSPLSGEYPGVEVQATAIENILRGDQVHVLGPGWLWLASLMGAIAAAIGATFPLKVTMKLAASVVVLVLLIAAGVGLFVGPTIRWLPLATPTVATIVATVVGMAWSYGVADRRRLFMLKALQQYVSPAVVAELSKHPEKLDRLNERREMTVMFTDIQGFTDLSEKLENQKLTALLNFYLDEMTAIVLEKNGTLDKYIGDAIMSFYNAPLEQTDHAVRACRVALGMAQREEQLKQSLADMGGEHIFTRIGINSGLMAVGNFGSSKRFDYTVLGDAVNLGRRLEGANKFYGTRIIASESTAEKARGQILMRKLDVLRVKGKLKPMGVYEVLADGEGEESQRRLAARYEEALKLYQTQQWDSAEAILLELLKDFPEDGPCKVLLKRLGAFRTDPPPRDWDGVYVAKEK